MNVKVALNIPDCHIPWQSESNYSIMLEVAKDIDKQFGLTEINIMGDFLDFLWLGLHPKMPSLMSVKETLKDEIYQGIKKLEELRLLFPDATINYIEGNHEYRLVRYIVAKCPELYDLFTLSDILQFDRLSINHIPFGKHQKHNCLDTGYFLRHQPYNMGKNCASGTAHSKGISLGFGHTHRKQTYTIKRGDGTEVECRSLGWLGDRTAPVFDYVDHDDWTSGFEVVFSVDGKWFPHYIDIKDNKAVFNGYVYHKKG